MPELRHAPRRWLVVTVAIIVLALIAIGTAVYTATVSERSARSAAEVVALQAQVAAAEAVRVAEANAARKRAQAECRGSIAGSKIGATIVEDLRSTYLELADIAANQEFVTALRDRASRLPMFPAPTCDPGPKAASR